MLRSVDLLKLNITDDVTSRKSNVIVEEGVIKIDGVQVFYRQAYPLTDAPKFDIDVLLLHGQRFSSKTWLDLGTIHTIAASGYHVVAVDIPGYGNSPSAKIEDRAAFLASLIEVLNLQNPVIVSPSLSGFFTLPFIIRNPEILSGYVPVAPVGIEALEQLPSANDTKYKDMVCPTLQMFLHDPIPDLSFIQTPTMVVFGEKDRSRSSALLSLLPNSQCQEIPNGSHPAYLDNPDLWHQLLYNFLYTLAHN